jgi:hypothetical protein
MSRTDRPAAGQLGALPVEQRHHLFLGDGLGGERCGGPAQSQRLEELPTRDHCVPRSCGSGGSRRRRALSKHELHFNDEDDAKAEIRAAVRYLVKEAAGSDRGDIVREIIAIVNEVARGLLPGEHDPLDDGMPGG